MAQANKQFVCTYDAPLDDVMAMLLDAEFRTKVSEAQGLLSYDISITTDGDATIVAIDKQQPAAGLPAVATKLIGDRAHIVQRETWTVADMTLTLDLICNPGHAPDEV